MGVKGFLFFYNMRIGFWMVGISVFGFGFGGFVMMEINVFSVFFVFVGVIMIWVL